MYKEQLSEWLQSHPEATREETIEAGYWIACENWINQKR